jgi:hypothetical protein
MIDILPRFTSRVCNEDRIIQHFRPWLADKGIAR